MLERVPNTSIFKELTLVKVNDNSVTLIMIWRYLSYIDESWETESISWHYANKRHNMTLNFLLWKQLHSFQNQYDTTKLPLTVLAERKQTCATCKKSWSSSMLSELMFTFQKSLFLVKFNLV